MRPLLLAYRLAQPFSHFARLPRLPAAYLRYLAQLVRYSRLPGAPPVALSDLYPCVFDATHHTPFDSHYFHQDLWAFTHVTHSGASRHVDVGSSSMFVGMLSRLIPVTFVDYRPLDVALDGLAQVRGTITALPFADGSVPSLSCLHVAEHIGLGRYGDPLDPRGTERAAAELQRVLAPGGALYFSVPVGRPRTEFNAHRIHAPAAVPGLFPQLRLEAFSGVDDAGRLLASASPQALERCRYGCGFYLFRKPRRGEP